MFEVRIIVQCFISFYNSLAQAAQGMLAFAIFITHGLACYVAIDISWREYLSKRFKDSKHIQFWEYVTRTLLVLITC